MGALTPTSILAELRAHGARLRLDGGRIHVDGVRPEDLPPALVVAARHRREELLGELHHEAGQLVPALTAAQWRARFERFTAERLFVEGYERNAARSWAYYKVLVEWTAAHPDVDLLPSCQAEPIARMALAELGIFDPRAVTR